MGKTKGDTSAGSSGQKGKGERVKKSTKRRLKVKNEVRADSGVQLRGNQDDFTKATADRDTVVTEDSTKKHNTDMPNQSLYSKGRYTEPDTDRDELLKLKREYVKISKQPYGRLMMNEDDFKYLKYKKEQEEYLKDIKLASYLIDPERIDTQERTFKMFPELKDIPDKLHRESLGMQIRLRTLLRDGIIRGKEDHAFIMKVCRGDTFLPLFPLWDPEGKLIREFASDRIVVPDTIPISEVKLEHYYNWPGENNPDQVKRMRGIWNPIRWSSGYENDELFKKKKEMQAVQLVYKVAIIRRLYRGLRSLKFDEIRNFMNQFSPILPGNSDGTASATEFNRPTGNNYMKFFSNISGVEYGNPKNALVGPPYTYEKDW